jgi:hypothetical protein
MDMPPRRRFQIESVVLALVVAVLIGARALGAPAPASAPQIDVILWFDTEDYLLPADDDAAKRLAEMLSQRNIRATFKVVGEKARVLEKRGRSDVIEALKKHAIGYHSNFHSVHPAPTEYLAECGLLDGMAEFTRHEARGAADVRRIFGVPSLVCYGQPGSSWASQAIAALGDCGVIAADGVPCYVDSGTHVGFGGKPFWYCGALVVYHMKPNETRMDLWGDGGLERGEKDFAAIADHLAGEGGGLISIFYHPCEWVHQTFWDGVNFGRGANPPREQWKPPPQRPPEQTDAAFERFAAYLDFMRGRPGVRFVTAADLPGLYPDRVRTEGASDEQILALARAIASPDFKGLDDQTIGAKIFSPAEQFALLTLAVGQLIDGPDKATYPLLTHPGLLGPDAPPPATPQEARPPLPWPAFRDAVLDVRDYLRTTHRIPPHVFIGPDPIAPADFVPALATAFVAHHDAGKFPDTIALGNGVEVLTARFVAKDSPNLFGGWVIHRANFRAPKVMEVGRLQAWTLKPATGAQSASH